MKYLSSAARMLQWAKLNHAHYYISPGPPEPGAVNLFATQVPFLGWTLNTARYRTHDPLVLYRLP